MNKVRARREKPTTFRGPPSLPPDVLFTKPDSQMLSIPARIWLLAFAITSLLVSTSVAQSLADLLTGAELADPAQRANVVARMQAIERTRRDAALKLAGQRGLPLRVVKPNGAV